MAIKYLDSKRIVKLSSDVAIIPTFEDDFTGSSSPADWNPVGVPDIYVNAGLDKLVVKMDRTNTNNKVAYDLGAGNVSDTDWVLRYHKVNFSVVGASNAYGYSGISSTDQDIDSHAGSQYFIGLIWNDNGEVNRYGTVYANNQAIPGRSNTGSYQTTYTPSTGVNYWVEIKRSNDTMTITWFTDEFLTSAWSISQAVPSAVAGLRYLTFQNPKSNTSDVPIQFTVDQVDFYNGEQSTKNKPTNVQDNSILVEKDTANRYWFDALSESPVNITWSTTGNVAYNISGTTISRTGSSGWGTSKIQSEDTFTVGDGTFMIEFSGGSGSTNSTMLGFNQGTLGYYIGSPENKADFSIYMAGGSQVEVYESGSKNYDSGGSRSASDKYRIQIDNDGLVKYYLQAGGTGSWVLKYTSSTTASGTYFIQANSYSSTSVVTVHSKTVTTPATWTLESPVTQPSGLTIWYDFSDVSTITKDSSNRISAVADKTSNGFNLVQATGGAQPLWVASNKNSLDVIDFAGSRYMASTFASMSNATGYSIVLACVVPADNNTSMFSSTSPASAKLRTYNTGTLALENSGTVTTSPVISGLNGSWHTIVCIGNGSSTKVYIDGTLMGTGTMNENLVNWLIGAESTGGGYSNSKQGELIAYNRVLSATEISNLHTYLKNKWGL